MTFFDVSDWTGRYFTGEWVAAAEVAAVRSPSTGGELAAYGVASAANLAEAVARAVDAQREWARRSAEDRSAVLRKAASIIETPRLVVVPQSSTRFPRDDRTAQP